MTGRDPFSVVSRNRETLDREEEKLNVGRRLLGRDAATVLAPAIKNATGDPAATAEALFLAGESVKETLAKTEARVAFVLRLLELCGIAESDLFPVLPEGQPLRVLYARAGAADRAFRLVSGVYPDLRVGYAETNLDAAEGVEAGDADLLLLPYADAAGTPVLSTETLSETHGLYLTALARISVGEGLFYGLYGRAILPGSTGRVTLHFSLPSPDAETLSGLYSFARETGLSPDGALPATPERRARIALSGKKRDCLAAAVYAHLFCPGCELLGWRAASAITERR